MRERLERVNGCFIFLKYKSATQEKMKRITKAGFKKFFLFITNHKR